MCLSVYWLSKLIVAWNIHTTYNTHLDITACLKYIYKVYGPSKIYTIAYGMGSVTFSCGLFDSVNLHLLNLLIKMGYKSHVITNDYTLLNTPENAEYLRSILFLLFVGYNNAVLSTKVVKCTYKLLIDVFSNENQ